MKVLHYIPSLSPSVGPLADRVRQLAAASGGEVWECDGLNMLLTARQTRKHLAECRPDIVHVHGAWNWRLALVERIARKAGCATIVSPHGALAPELLAIDFVKRKLLPFVCYQAPMIRHATALIADSEREWHDISDLNLKKRVEILPADAEALPAALHAAYLKAYHTTYRSHLSADDIAAVRAIVVARTTGKPVPTLPEASLVSSPQGIVPPLLLHAYDEDVLALLPDAPDDETIAAVPRYISRTAKRRGAVSELPLPKRKLRTPADKLTEREALTTLLRAHHEGLKRLTLRHKTEIYRLFRYADFNEDLVAADLKRLHMRRFTKRLQQLTTDIFGLTEGYYIL